MSGLFGCWDWKYSYDCNEWKIGITGRCSLIGSEIMSGEDVVDFIKRLFKMKGLDPHDILDFVVIVGWFWDRSYEPNEPIRQFIKDWDEFANGR